MSVSEPTTTTLSLTPTPRTGGTTDLIATRSANSTTPRTTALANTTLPLPASSPPASSGTAIAIHTGRPATVLPSHVAVSPFSTAVNTGSPPGETTSATAVFTGHQANTGALTIQSSGFGPTSGSPEDSEPPTTSTPVIDTPNVGSTAIFTGVPATDTPTPVTKTATVVATTRIPGDSNGSGSPGGSSGSGGSVFPGTNTAAAPGGGSPSPPSSTPYITPVQNTLQSSARHGPSTEVIVAICVSVGLVTIVAIGVFSVWRRIRRASRTNALFARGKVRGRSEVDVEHRGGGRDDNVQPERF
ncbi:hypothetical protein C8Q79DRAFT_187179 [Trametes meyenii]|nr:hypothetical protein C8Q79DRAFT_187179 [Trametes meyenii]